MVFSNKVILIISSEAWGKIFISKHHYALTLAQLGNTVYFLNPPPNKLSTGSIKVEKSSLNENLSIISYSPFFPLLLKFHIKWLFEILIKIQVKKILKKLKLRFDLVWDFNTSYLYHDLSIFNAQVNIFHPVDVLSIEASEKKADIFFSVSHLILNDYKVANIPKFLINHGLSKQFETIASEMPLLVNYNNREIKAGYVGNLIIPMLDRYIIKQVASDHPDVDFTFIGPYNVKENNISIDFNAEDEAFIYFLKNQSNVNLTGILSTEELAKEINKFDIFLICYKNSLQYRCDNSHKVLEYLSTGKVVVSTPILFYQNSDLLEMSTGSADYANLFSKIINNLDLYNSFELMNRRKAFAKNNTYEKHIKEIEGLINEHVLN